MKTGCMQCGAVWNVGDSYLRAEVIEATHFEKTGHSMFRIVKRGTA